MSLLLTRILNLRERTNMDQNELRYSRYGATMAHARMTGQPGGIISDRFRRKAMDSIGSTIETPVFDAKTVTVTATRPLVVPDDENTSRMIQFNWVTLSVGWTQTRAQHWNNEITPQEDFDWKYNSAELALMTELESLAVANLESGKSLVLNKNLGTYAFNAGVVEATLAQEERVFGDINPLMNGNDYYNNLSLVIEPGSDSIIRNTLDERGKYNERDKGYQIGDKMLYHTNAITPAAGKKAALFAIDSANLGMMFRGERDARMGTRMEDGTEWGMTTLVNYPDIPMGTFYYQSAQDRSALAAPANADLTRTKVDHFHMSIDVAFATAYNSDSANRANPILKLDVSAT